MKIITLVVLLTLPALIHAQTPTLDARKSVNELMDQWHIDAATADFDGYFGAIHKEGRFLGTDKTERWSKEEFISYAKDGFASKRTWDFKPSSRELFFSEDLTYAWFDELLDTWMGPCRGSAVVKKTENGWKIMQYNLAILVDNTVVNDYLDLIGVEKKDN